MATISWFVRKKSLGALGAIILIAWILVAILAEQIAPHNPNTQAFTPLQPPSTMHLAGTDQYGRDLFSRLVFGSRISIVVGISTVTIALVLALAIGIPSAFWGGTADLIVQRIVDMMLSFPGLLFALLVAATLGPSLTNVIISIALGKTAAGIRLVRGMVLSEREKEYVMSARVIGCSKARICFRHINPNVIPMSIILAATAVGDSILADAGMSFLGLGVPPPASSWGSDLSLGRSSFLLAPWLAVFPGLALTSAIFAFNMLGDSLRDLLDPRIRRRGV